MAAIEVTTRIGCAVSCSYCPQGRILGSYPELRSSGHLMTLEIFERCLARLPVGVDLHFSGFSEPWQNPDATGLVLAACGRGHRVAIFTTLVGMTIEDVQKLETASIGALVIHLPADDASMRVDVGPAYLAVLGRLLHGSLPVRTKFHGARLHPRVAGLVEESRRAPLHTRAGNVALPDRPAPRRLLGELRCNRDPVQHVLLPNGGLVLCCMDWSMRHVVGNLLESDYEEILSGPELRRVLDGWKDESQEVLCRRCERRAVSVDWRAKLHNRWLPEWRRRLGLG